MRSTVRRAALAWVLMAAVSAGCATTEADIDHWKRTQRGPGKITAVLVSNRFAQPLRVRAARALVEMRHPNANGLELLVQAMNSMPGPDREAIIHDLSEWVRAEMRGAAQQGSSAQGPSEMMIKAKDAAYLMLRFAAPADRTELSRALMDWLMTDLNSRALAGQYTGEQIVTAVGASAVERLAQGITADRDSIAVSGQIATLINSVGTDAGKDLAAGRLVTVLREVLGPAGEGRLRGIATELLRHNNTEATDARVAAGVTQLRGQFLTVLMDALRTLNRPEGTRYLIELAGSPVVSLEQRKLALTAVAGQVRAENAAALLAIANSTGPNVDVDLRGIAVDRVGETRDRGAVAALYTLWESVNGGLANQEFTLRWKAGEALIKLGGPEGIAEFARRLTVQRPATAQPPPRGAPAGTPGVAAFEGYTLAEMRGYAAAIGDFSPAPVAAMRGFLTSPSVEVRSLTLFFLALRGEASDATAIAGLRADTTAIRGIGWEVDHLTNLGAVARRAHRDLLSRLSMPADPVDSPPEPAAPAAPAPAAGH